MKKIDVLVWGLQLIAASHGCMLTTEGTVMFSESNISLLTDVQNICDDLKIPRCYIYAEDKHLILGVPKKWCKGDGETQYKETGLEAWKPKNYHIPS